MAKRHTDVRFFGNTNPKSASEARAISEINRDMKAINLEPRDLDWQAQGACVNADPELFFHPDGERGPEYDARDAKAKAVCVTCPVINECLNTALKINPVGVWGGTTIEERQLIIKKRKK